MHKADTFVASDSGRIEVEDAKVDTIEFKTNETESQNLANHERAKTFVTASRGDDDAREHRRVGTAPMIRELAVASDAVAMPQGKAIQ